MDNIRISGFAFSVSITAAIFIKTDKPIAVPKDKPSIKTALKFTIFFSLEKSFVSNCKHANNVTFPIRMMRILTLVFEPCSKTSGSGRYIEKTENNNVLTSIVTIAKRQLVKIHHAILCLHKETANENARIISAAIGKSSKPGKQTSNNNCAIK